MMVDYYCNLQRYCRDVAYRRKSFMHSITKKQILSCFAIILLICVVWVLFFITSALLVTSAGILRLNNKHLRNILNVLWWLNVT